MNTELMAVDLSSSQFDHIKKLLHSVCGISLQSGKEGLVKARLTKRLRALRLPDFDRYLDHLHNEPSRQELSLMVDALTTNKTNFFREQQHFDFLKNYVLTKNNASKMGMRFWSAACSSGEEPFSLAILLNECWSDVAKKDVRILATDISSDILEKARKATYREDLLQEMPEALLRKYFSKVTSGNLSHYQANDNIRDLVRFARLNLMATWPMKGLFDVIFCRNVMIYFDTPTREQLVNRYYDYLKPGGYLFIGHSESLTGISHPFDYVQPAIYKK